MSTYLWLAIVLLALLAGYVLRIEQDRYRRNVYDVDFTTRRIGE